MRIFKTQYARFQTKSNGFSLTRSSIFQLQTDLRKATGLFKDKTIRGAALPVSQTVEPRNAPRCPKATARFSLVNLEEEKKTFSGR